MTNAKRDDNRVPGLLGVSSADGVTVLPVKINPATGRVLAEGVGGSGDAIFDVSTGVIVQNVDGGITAYTDDLVIGSSGLNDTGTAAHDQRIIWDKSQGFFAAGEVNGTEWDTANRGYAAASFGWGNKVVGEASFAAGEFHELLGNYQFVAGGFGNTLVAGNDSCYSLGDGNTVGSVHEDAYTSGAFGNSNEVYGYTSFAFGANNVIGDSGDADAVQNAVAMGDGNTVAKEADYSVVMGRNGRSKYIGSFTMAGNAFSGFSVGSQVTLVNQRIRTTNETPTELTFGGGSPSASNSMILPAGCTWYFEISVVARQTAGAAGTVGDSAIYKFTGGIKRDASNNTVLLGSVTKTVVHEDQAAWDCAVTADDTAESLAITVTGEASKTIAWLADIKLTEAASL